ncbi:MAG: hypothetical protein NC319_08260 [Butyricicoccus sp.]|nr:hypothetical protein [Butyricicoccus sp.]
MKKFIKGVVEWKIHACVLYTAAMFISLFFGTVSGTGEIPVANLWTLFWVCVAASLIQALCFSTWVIKKMRYTLRGLLFVLLFLPALALAAWKMGWFPRGNAAGWLMFAGIFLLIIAVMAVGFDIYFQVTGRKYDGLIGQYRKYKEQEERDS